MPVLFESTTTDNQPKTKTPDRVSPEKSYHSKHENGNLWSYMLNPKKIHFATQGKGEHIILFLRQHPITQVGWILSSFILLIIPPIIFPLLTNTFLLTIPINYAFIIVSFWYIMTLAYLFVNFVLWYYNVNIVTNERVIDVDFVYLLVQEVSATRITQIEDVTYKRSGAVASLFDYGNVFVQTAGTEASIEFLRIPRPKRVAEVLIDLLGEVT